MIKQVCYSAADRAKIARHQHCPVVFRQKLRRQKFIFAHGDSPPDEEFAHSNKKYHMHYVLDREWIKEVLRRMIENQDCSPPGERER